MRSALSFVIAVHGGAGYHDPSDDKRVKHALRLACSNAASSAAGQGSALDIAERAICTLEDDESLNAGYGSNLTWDGTVECDAALMEGATGHFGSVGALSGIKNPIRAARAVLDHAGHLDPLGRIPPLTLASSGAHDFAAARGCAAVSPESLISPRAHRDWHGWRARAEAGTSAHVPQTDASLHARQDTVGAVVWSEQDGFAAGVSSGGLLLKYPGRIGEAATFGAGCWAEQASQEGTAPGMACSVSRIAGAGEFIMRAAIAKAISERWKSEDDPDMHDVLGSVLVREQSHIDDETNNVGVIVLTKDEDAMRAY